MRHGRELIWQTFTQGHVLLWLTLHPCKNPSVHTCPLKPKQEGAHSCCSYPQLHSFRVDAALTSVVECTNVDHPVNQQLHLYAQHSSPQHHHHC